MQLGRLKGYLQTLHRSISILCIAGMFLRDYDYCPSSVTISWDTVSKRRTFLKVEI